MRVTLSRHDTGDHGTFGKIAIQAGATRFTIELPDRGNAPQVSCIPTGTYSCAWNYSTHFRREMYQVLNVTDRSGIRIHSANLAGDVTKGLRSQLYGCIALGERLGTIEGQKCVLISKPAIFDFETLLKKQPFTLEILDVNP